MRARFRFVLGLIFALSIVAALAAQATRVISSGTLPTNCTVGSIYIKTGTSAGPYWCSATDTWTAMGGGGTALSGITAASGSNTIASGNNSGQVWNWALTSNSVTAFTFGETSAATGGSGSAQVILGINTLASSTATPLYVKCYGGADLCFRLDDVSGDTTPFVIAADGKVGIGTASPGQFFEVNNASGGVIARFTGGADSIDIYSGTQIGNNGANDLSFYTGGGTIGLTVRNTTGGILVRRPSTPTTLTAADSYLRIGNAEDALNGYYNIMFGYQGNRAFMGFQETDNTGQTKGDLVFGVRSDTSSSNPTEVMRIDSNDSLIFPRTSPTPAVSNTSANSCGTTAATIAGNNVVGTVTVGATGGTDCTLTFSSTAPVEWICQANNQTTTANLVSTIPASTTTARLVGTFGAADKLNYLCIAR